ncbi:MAG: L,D-transpeptidase [Actinomycetota bacterium]|nr:L,D-transpeptidase [Actinomycetota bacterium]
MANGRHVHQRRRSVVLLVILAVTLSVGLVFAGAAYAAIRYERAHADRIMPGVRIDGLDVSGLTRTEALDAVRAAAHDELRKPLTITVGSEHWTVTPATLGRRAAVAAAVNRAMDAGSELGTLDRAWHRFRDEALGVDIPLAHSTVGSGVEDFASMIAKRMYVAPVNAAIDITPSHTDITFVHAKDGVKFNIGGAEAAITQALADGRQHLTLGTKVVEPKVTEQTLGRTIVVRLNENRLYLYEGFHVLTSFSVATAKPGFTTPSGVWTIYDKKENPTWYNPALDSWGADLPAVIPGGPGNPMGTRAIYIDAPGLIRIHGTSDDSSIGRYASHGCIRMHNSEVERLYPMIDVGDHVIVVGARPRGAQYWSVPPASDI